jgi:hypothetical protein
VVFRAFTVYLVVGVLVACPFPCLAKAAEGTSAACTGGGCGACDCCCPDSGSESDGDGPVTPDCCDGGTCLCHGAVVEPHVQLPSPQAEPAVLACIEDVLALAAISGFDAVAVDRTACHFPSADSGRKVRALIESLLL